MSYQPPTRTTRDDKSQKDVVSTIASSTDPPIQQSGNHDIHERIMRRFSNLKKDLPLLQRQYGEMLGPYVVPVPHIDATPTGSASRGEGHVIMRTLIINKYYEPCLEPLSDLVHIKIRDLEKGRHYVGRKLVAKVIAKGLESNGLGVIIQDRTGNSIPVMIHHGYFDISPEELLPVGTLLAIKQPLLEVGREADGYSSFWIRVDHASDLHLMYRPGVDGLHNTKSAWRDEGIKAWEAGDYSKAFRSYMKGIEASDLTAATAPPNLASYRDRTEVKVEHQSGAEVLQDTNIAAALFPGAPLPGPCNGAVDRQEIDLLIEWCNAFALYKGREWQACYQACRKRLQYKTAKHEEGPYLLMLHALARQHEETYGLYDWDTIHSQQNADRVDTDIGDYTALVRTGPAGDMGRGLFARSDIPVGNIVLAEKAFAYAKGINDDGSTTVLVTYDLHADGPEIHFGEDLLGKIFQKLRDLGPDVRQRFFALNSGDYESSAAGACPEIDGQIVLDSFLVRKIVMLNSMNCGPDSRKGQDRGIWITASYINHACKPNCDVMFFGDMLVIRPKRNIVAGEQLTLNYVPLLSSNRSERRRVLERVWGFVCACDACLKT